MTDHSMRERIADALARADCDFPAAIHPLMAEYLARADAVMEVVTADQGRRLSWVNRRVEYARRAGREEILADLAAATHFLVGAYRVGRRRDHWEVWGDPSLGGYVHVPDPEAYPSRDEALARARELADEHTDPEEADR